MENANYLEALFSLNFYDEFEDAKRLMWMMREQFEEDEGE